MARIYTEPQLNELCKSYQELLRLQDWKIEVQLVDQRHMPNNHGMVEMQHKKQYALIKIPTADTWTAGFAFIEQDMHATLIHEMVHILFAAIHPDQLNTNIKGDDLEYDIFEFAIHRLSMALQQLLPEPVFGTTE